VKRYFSVQRFRWNVLPDFLILEAEDGTSLSIVLNDQKEGVMSERQTVAWEKAAACEAHAQATKDVKLQAMFRKLRDSWIRIGNGAQFSEPVIENENRITKQNGS
jgi:hypothetical protein